MPAYAAVEEERVPQFHDLDALLAAGNRAEAASSARQLHEALAAGGCLWGHRQHRMSTNPDKTQTCTRCGRDEGPTPRNFNKLADALIRRLMPRIPEAYRGGFERTMASGEYAMAIDDLVVVVDTYRIELSPDDTAVLSVLTGR